LPGPEQIQPHRACALRTHALPKRRCCKQASLLLQLPGEQRRNEWQQIAGEAGQGGFRREADEAANDEEPVLLNPDRGRPDKGGAAGRSGDGFDQQCIPYADQSARPAGQKRAFSAIRVINVTPYTSACPWAHKLRRDRVIVRAGERLALTSNRNRQEIDMTRHTSYHVSAARKFSGLFLAGIAALAVAGPADAAKYQFSTIDNPTDATLQNPTFNQLLGINNDRKITGYFGDGAVVGNMGFFLTLKNNLPVFVEENVPGAAQTQVVGINNLHTGTHIPITVGFWVDGDGTNYGFYRDIKGAFYKIVNPATPIVQGVPQMNQLLGINDKLQAAGFYINASGAARGYIYDANNSSFSADITLPQSFKAVSITATGINNNGLISGFYTDKKGGMHGFLISAGEAIGPLDYPDGTNTMLFGINNNGQVVGTYSDGAGVSHGLLLQSANLPPTAADWLTVDDPAQSPNAAFGNVTGTVINGIDDRGDLVGFYSDGTNVHGMLALKK
jgi:hypothetical protein